MCGLYVSADTAFTSTPKRLSQMFSLSTFPASWTENMASPCLVSQGGLSGEMDRACSLDMGIHNGWSLFPAQPFNGFQHNQLVPEIQGLQLIPGPGMEGPPLPFPGNEHHLEFLP